MKQTLTRAHLRGLPATIGVYLFYGSQDALLYVGKSKNIRSRVRAHFSSPDEAWLRRKVRRIEVRETAGELGALLLESQLIKELRPFYNVAARSRRRIIIARRTENARGYAGVVLEAVDRLDPDGTGPIMAIFKHKTQAKEYLAGIARTHRLCPKLLRLETARKYCFWYHLGQCEGACMGEEDVPAYNARFEQAFEARRIKAWPFPGGVKVEERSSDEREREVFLIDNWCLLASYRFRNGSREEFVPEDRRFDYDSYKILYSYLMDESNRGRITVLGKETFKREFSSRINR